MVYCDNNSVRNGATAEEESATMGVPHITSFCCCMGLEMGAKFVGFVHLLASLSFMVVCAVFAEGTRGYIGTVEDEPDGLYTKWYNIAVAVAVLSVVHVLLALVLIVSAFRRSTCGLRVWSCVMCALLLAALLFVVVHAAMHGLSASGSDIFLSLLEGLLFFGFIAYCLLGVNSYYLMLKSAEDMEGPKSIY